MNHIKASASRTSSTAHRKLSKHDRIKSTKVNLSHERNFPNEVFHIVVKGDTLYSISKKYNISIEEIIKNNNIKGTNISLGQILKIP